MRCIVCKRHIEPSDTHVWDADHLFVEDYLFRPDTFNWDWLEED